MAMWRLETTRELSDVGGRKMTAGAVPSKPATMCD
jgi:hypothetical protein